MAIDFKIYRVFCAAPPEVEPECEEFHAAVARFVERVSMPEGVLFAPASLRPPMSAANHKPTIENNIRECEFFIQIFGEEWPDPVFPGFVEYAIDCAADPAMYTRAVCVFFRNHDAAAPELRTLRERLTAREGCELRDFSGTEDLRGQFDEMLSGWYGTLKPEAG